MKKLYHKIAQCISVFFLSVLLFHSFAAASLSKGNKFRSFFWTQGVTDSVKNGCYGDIKIDSISTKTNHYFCGMWLSYSWWKAIFPNQRLKTAITVSKSKPAAVTNASGHFSSVEWFTGFERTGSKDTVRFYFPMLPQTTKYGKYDYFTVSVNDTLALQFYGAGDSIMVGTFVHKKPTVHGAINILARNAFIVELTNANPFRIKSIRCNSTHIKLLNSYLKFNLTRLKNNVAWYGIDITWWKTLAKTTESADIDDETSPLLPIVPSFTPSSFNHGLKIHYTLPVGVSRFTISLFDLKGRCIKQVIKQTDGFTSKGSVQIDNKLNTGYYFIQLKAVLNNGHTPLIMRKQWTNIR